jgi:hypothetical protein
MNSSVNSVTAVIAELEEAIPFENAGPPEWNRQGDTHHQLDKGRLGRTIAKLFRGAGLPKLRLSVELCAMYWHFLLLVWLMLLALLTGWTVAFLDVCSHLISG